jgi:hypothetical protein
MIYQPGDYVYPADLPRPMLCRVQEAERADTRTGGGQILVLDPLDGPWPAGTTLIRLDGAVVPAWPRQLRKATARPGTTAAALVHQPEWPNATRLHAAA